MAVFEFRTTGARACRASEILRRLTAAPLIAALLLALAVAPASAQADAPPVKGEVSVTVAPEGYARLIFRMAEEIDSDVRVSNGIIVIRFKQPVDVTVDRMAAAAIGYVGAARRDPDGTAIRIALARKVRVNSIVAGERLFVDLLPEPWTGVVPGLPQEVVEELSRRARDAEKRARQDIALKQQQRNQTLIRVRVGKQPTFTRYSFDLPRSVTVANDQMDDQITLTFDAPIKFDLSDAQVELPEGVRAIESDADEDSTAVRIALSAKVDMRTFREDGSYVIDIGRPDPNQQTQAASDDMLEIVAPGNGERPANAPVAPASSPETHPAGKTAPAAAPPKPTAAAVEPPRDPAPDSAKPKQAVPASASPRAETDMPLAPVPGMQQAVVSPAEQKPAPAAATAPAATTAPAAKTATEVSPKVATPPAPGALVAQMVRQGDDLRIKFPFGAPTPAAVFRRADPVWVVFDTKREMDVQVLDADPTGSIRGATLTRSGDAEVLRIKLERPRLTSLVAEGPNWQLTIGDAVESATRPLLLARNAAAPARVSAVIPFDDPSKMHRIADPEVGDNVIVITAMGPARGFLKTQDFVEFRALASTHGVVLQPLADDVAAELSADKIVVSRPVGLTLSTGSYAQVSGGPGSAVFDPQVWGFDRQADFGERQTLLIRMAADATEQRRNTARLDLARFYLAQGFDAEAKAVLDVALGDHITADEVPGLVLRSVCEIKLDHPDDALKDLAHPLVGNQYDAPLWRAMAHTQQGKYSDAREGFKAGTATIGTLPIELQRYALEKAIQAYIEVRDFAGAAAALNDLETVGFAPRTEARITLLRGRLAEGLARASDALTFYKAAATAWDRPAAAQAQLRLIALRASLGDLLREDVISELEGLAVSWRGDQTEVETLQLLARLYTEEKRYRDAFYIMRTAMLAHPNSEMTRRIHDEAAATFDSIFLGGKGDGLPTIDALSLFYDFRELTPIGRRGDEMIRRLADRLVSVDLLDQAAELLQYQIDHRLQGAARAQVATRLAVVYLMNRKPDRAMATLRSTRTADLSNELRNQRLLLESRALSDMKRYDVALEVIAHVPGKEAIRLRSDILWAAKRWAESAEQLELLYGNRWQEFSQLADTERGDILRAAIGFALGEDTIGLMRFREKYTAKMAEGPDRRAFEVITAPAGTGGAEFREVAKAVAAVDTLDGFLRALKTRFPESGTIGNAAPPGKQSQAPATVQQAAR
jgi:hypothetical protein